MSPSDTKAHRRPGFSLDVQKELANPDPRGHLSAPLRREIARVKGSTDHDALDRDLAAYREDPQQAVPTALVDEILKVVDVAFPKSLEERAVRIATLLSEGKTAAEIAKETGIHPKAVKVELDRIAYSRSLYYRSNPDIGKKVVAAHFDVLSKTQELYEKGVEVIDMVQQTIKEDFDSRKEMPTLDEASVTCKRKHYTGVRPGMVEQFAKLMESMGKQLDRAGEITKVMRGADNRDLNVLLSNVQFTNVEVNEFASQFLSAKGQTPLDTTKVFEISAFPAQENSQQSPNASVTGYPENARAT